MAALAWCGSLLSHSAAEAQRAEMPPAASVTVVFDRDIKPLLERHCYACHGVEKQEGGLRWDLKSSATKGGLSGRAFVPGNSRESRLIQLVSGLDPQLVMPRKGPRLTQEQIGLLRAWIDQGASWPDSSELAPEEHWAFKPAKRHAVPPVQSRGWARNAIDYFILATLEEKYLAPSGEADRRALMRRLSFDLHGLPPETDELQRFLDDGRPDAYERLVDRLLASPRYGERWARHWLDVVHYGDSHGYDKDKPRANAWPYRDYVIDAFNSDKAYSRFVQEQLAADALFPESPQLIPALGFIAAGPWDFVGHVELAESKTDGLIARYNDRDDMVMSTMSTFLSLTVHCARCHNHKFDPIPQRDYYALQAVFAGVDRADRDYDPDPIVHAKRRALVSERKQVTENLVQLSNALAAVTAPELTEIDTQLAVVKASLKQLPDVNPDSPANGYHSRIEKKPDIEKWVEVDLRETRVVQSITLLPARPTDFPDTPGFGFPRRFRIEIGTNDSNLRIAADYTVKVYPNPGSGPVSITLPEGPVRRIRVTAVELWERTRDYVFALAELQALSSGTNVAAGAAVRALDSIEAGRWGKAFLVDGYDSRKRLIDLTPDVATKRRNLEQERDTLTARRQQIVRGLVSTADRRRLDDNLARMSAIERELRALPAPHKVYAATGDFKAEGSFVPARGVRPVHLLRRGDVRSPSDPMQPAALSRVPTLEHAFQCDNESNESARRAALAKWITDRHNMLMRRSIVNRVWQYHFGRGLVDTPNDFGRMGATPSHPELLDWLAYWFVDNGESLKELHRLILTSATWRQSSFSRSSQAAAIDGDNRLLWRMNRRRLDAEEIRDALLHASEQLSLQMGGPAARMFRFKDDHSPVYDYSRFDVDDPAARRRSIYRFIVRSVPDPLMDCLDAADPNLLVPKRNTTLTALQALSLLNNAFVLRQAERLAERIGAEHKTIEAQVQAACLYVLARRPRREEAEALVLHAREYGMPSLCRLLFNSNEFIFID